MASTNLSRTDIRRRVTRIKKASLLLIIALALVALSGFFNTIGVQVAAVVLTIAAFLYVGYVAAPIFRS